MYRCTGSLRYAHHKSPLGPRMDPCDNEASTARHPSCVSRCEGHRLVDVLHHLRCICGVHGTRPPLPPERPAAALPPCALPRCCPRAWVEKIPPDPTRSSFGVRAVAWLTTGTFRKAGHLSSPNFLREQVGSYFLHSKFLKALVCLGLR